MALGYGDVFERAGIRAGQESRERTTFVPHQTSFLKQVVTGTHRDANLRQPL